MHDPAHCTVCQLDRAGRARLIGLLRWAEPIELVASDLGIEAGHIELHCLAKIPRNWNLFSKRRKRDWWPLFENPHVLFDPAPGDYEELIYGRMKRARAHALSLADPRDAAIAGLIDQATEVFLRPEAVPGLDLCGAAATAGEIAAEVVVRAATTEQKQWLLGVGYDFVDLWSTDFRVPAIIKRFGHVAMVLIQAAKAHKAKPDWPRAAAAYYVRQFFCWAFYSVLRDYWNPIMERAGKEGRGTYFSVILAQARNLHEPVAPHLIEKLNPAIEEAFLSTKKSLHGHAWRMSVDGHALLNVEDMTQQCSLAIAEALAQQAKKFPTPTPADALQVLADGNLPRNLVATAKLRLIDSWRPQRTMKRGKGPDLSLDEPLDTEGDEKDTHKDRLVNGSESPFQAASRNLSIEKVEKMLRSASKNRTFHAVLDNWFGALRGECPGKSTRQLAKQLQLTPQAVGKQQRKIKSLLEKIDPDLARQLETLFL